MSEGKLVDMSGKTLQYECPQCRAHDIETKKLMEQLFSREEIIGLAMMLAQNITVTRKALRQAAPNNHLRPAHMANMDFMCAMIGKFFVSLEEKDLNAIMKFIKDRSGMEFKVQHETCPHKKMEEESANSSGPPN